MASGGLQRPDQVEVDAGETAGSDRYLCWL
jgi:hypothetical protein